MMQRQEAQKKNAPARPVAKAPGAPTRKQRTSPRQFTKEVAGELRKVAWPNRQEVFSYSLVVLVSSLVIAAFIFAIDTLFGEGVLLLFGVET